MAYLSFLKPGFNAKIWGFQNSTGERERGRGRKFFIGRLGTTESRVSINESGTRGSKWANFVPKRQEVGSRESQGRQWKQKKKKKKWWGGGVHGPGGIGSFPCPHQCFFCVAKHENFVILRDLFAIFEIIFKN